jgi:hypothetical protein
MIIGGKGASVELPGVTGTSVGSTGAVTFPLLLSVTLPWLSASVTLPPLSDGSVTLPMTGMSSVTLPPVLSVTLPV